MVNYVSPLIFVVLAIAGALVAARIGVSNPPAGFGTIR